MRLVSSAQGTIRLSGLAEELYLVAVVSVHKQGISCCQAWELAVSISFQGTGIAVPDGCDYEVEACSARVLHSSMCERHADQAVAVPAMIRALHLQDCDHVSGEACSDS